MSRRRLSGSDSGKIASSHSPSNFPRARRASRLVAGVQAPRIYNGTFEKIHEAQLSRQDHFEIVGRVQGVLVVLGVTGPEMDVVVRAEKAEQAQEEVVEGLAFEDCGVTQFVEAVEQKGVERAVEKEDQQQPRQGQVLRCVPSPCARRRQQTQMPQRL